MKNRIKVRKSGRLPVQGGVYLCVHLCGAVFQSASLSPGNDAAGSVRWSSDSCSRCDTATAGRSFTQRHRRVFEVSAASCCFISDVRQTGCSRSSSDSWPFCSLESRHWPALTVVAQRWCWDINSHVCVHITKIGLCSQLCVTLCPTESFNSLSLVPQNVWPENYKLMCVERGKKLTDALTHFSLKIHILLFVYVFW